MNATPEVDFAHTAQAQRQRGLKAQTLARWCYTRGLGPDVVERRGAGPAGDRPRGRRVTAASARWAVPDVGPGRAAAAAASGVGSRAQHRLAVAGLLPGLCPARGHRVEVGAPFGGSAVGVAAHSVAVSIEAVVVRAGDDRAMAEVGAGLVQGSGRVVVPCRSSTPSLALLEEAEDRFIVLDPGVDESGVDVPHDGDLLEASQAVVLEASIDVPEFVVVVDVPEIGWLTIGAKD